MKYYDKYMNSPVGELTLIRSGKGLAAGLWESDDRNGELVGLLISKKGGVR